ncbi:putative transposase [Acidiphilium multivorum AIU301]|uniref:Putative transposase n=1 Tax=Acidiphilium multivorum (strain DSM 11245 / JCM 8867 / NBRC 100883 / AIU 301) TaxID=926570 RepID=F0J112_ACIMA|nr:IS5 family transposase [Acidiphilium multivorum]BAJ79394.1 putative transposase [Acidiphilium multivorum AIU301]
MPPKLNASQDDLELFRSRLENIIDQRHPLTRLARLIDWRVFEERFGALYAEAAGRPALPTRLMVALHLLKHMDGLSDEAICARYLDSPYVQAFCGETHFQHTLPLDRSSMTRWRKRIGAERMEALLAETLAAAERGGAVAEKHYERVTIDTTVQPKAVTHPTDSKLLHSGIETLARMARKHGITLRQSYRRVARYARQEAARLHHGGKRREAEARVRKLRTWLGRLARDITRKIAGNAEAKATFAETLGLINRLLRQKRSDRGADKLYSLHAPEVECIGKGKARTRFEFGVKISIATTNGAAPGGQFVLGMQSQSGNPYDGHTLAGQIEQVERITGVAVARAYVDRGYRGHGVEAEGRRIFISRQKRGITSTIRRELRRRTAIEPVIGHMKTDGHLGRNFLLGVDGDAINAVLAGAGHNLRLLRRWLIRLLCALLAWLSAPNRSPSLGFAHRQIS